METWDVRLCLPGCPSLTGPSSVSGTTGGSVSVQCRYEDVYKGYNKYWRGQYDTACDVIVETKGEEKEERNGCVTIRDHADNLTLMVTVENLNTDDAGSYWCRIQTMWILDALSHDPSVQVNVSVYPDKSSLHSSSRIMGFVGKVAANDLHLKGESQCRERWGEEGIRPLPRRQLLVGHLVPHRSLLSSIHFLLLVFLKVPLFLSILSAVLWVNRPQRDPGGSRVSLSRRNHRSPSQECLVPGYGPSDKMRKTFGLQAPGQEEK
ncbi:LOW QUALITY PROTEIN: CMRF35-like molecule 2 [Trichechus inunguis]